MVNPSPRNAIAGIHRTLTTRLFAVWNRLGLFNRLVMVLLISALLPVIALYLAYSYHFEGHTLAYIHNTLTQVAQAQQRRLNHELQQFNEYSALVASRTQMRLSLAAYNETRHSGDLELIQRILVDVHESIHSLQGLWIRDVHGQVIAGVVDSEFTHIDIPAAPNADDPALMFIKVANRLTPRIWLSRSLSLDNTPIGSLHLLMRNDNLRTVLEDFCCDRFSGQSLMLVYLADQSPVFIRRESLGRSVETMPWLEPLITEIAAQRDTLGQMQVAEYHTEDISIVYALRHLDTPQADILIVNELSYLAATLQQQRRLLAIDISISILLCILLALIMARIILNPIRQLIKATYRLRAGQFDVRIMEERQWGEFEVLARSFNQTAESLGEHTEQLRAEIRIRQQSQQELQNLANTDGLTRLINRRRFMELLAERMNHCTLDSGCGAVLYLDLDKFKPINDDYGHDFGDAVLRITAERLQRLVRSQDSVARLGGDEFAVLLADNEPGFEAETIAHRIEESLNLPMVIKNHRLQIGCSVGWTMINPGVAPQELLNAADAAMYVVKMARK